MEDVIEIFENKHGDKCDKCGNKKHPKIIIQTAEHLYCEECAIKFGLVEARTETPKEAPSSAKVNYKKVA